MTRASQEHMVAPTPARGTREILIAVPDKVHAKLVTLAKTANVSLTLYSTQLLMAAYAARHQATGDRDLDAAVARVAILDAVEDTPVEDIAGFVGLSVPTVKKILKAWHAEMAGQQPAKVKPCA